MKLHSEDVRAPGSTPSRTVLFLHGILGQGSNLRTVARRVVEARPDWRAVLVDLRGHGKSLGTDGRDSLEQCAEDVRELAAEQTLPVRAVVGHSFGGKVAMLLSGSLPGLEELVLLDSAPGTRLDFRGSELTMQVLGTLERVPETFETREAFTRHLEANGLTKDIAQWLTMSLLREHERYRFGPSVPRIRALLESYFSTDCWPLLEAMTRSGPRLHLVVGGRSLVFDDVELARARAIGVELTVLPAAGHWVHVDDLDGTVKAIVSALPS